MKALAAFICVLVCAGCNTEHKRQQRTVDYIRKHHCVSSYRNPPSFRWDKYDGKVEQEGGFTEYRCSNPYISIYVNDNELQP